MAVRVLLGLGALALLCGCAREGTPAAESQGVKPAPEPSQGSQDERLEAYFDRMTTLLLDEGLDGALEKGDREVRVLAETRVLATLEALDAAHKRQVMLFLVGMPAWSRARQERSPYSALSALTSAASTLRTPPRAIPGPTRRHPCQT